jgi:hypothetical protein
MDNLYVLSVRDRLISFPWFRKYAILLPESKIDFTG